MSLHSSLAALACAAVLAGCAGTPAAPPAPPAPPTLAVLLAQAESAVIAKQEMRAVGILKQAAQLYPREKAPWLRMAQVSFDCLQYGEAITYAGAVLERDPNDMKAHSIAAVSGLRVSSKALRDLADKNNVSGPVKLEAQQLVKFLRSSIGGEIIPPIRKAAPAKPPAMAANDPFRELHQLPLNGTEKK